MTVPVIDLSAERARVVEEVGRAGREIGFLAVVGHGVPEELVAETSAAGHAFFDLSEAEKRTFSRGRADARPPRLPAAP